MSEIVSDGVSIIICCYNSGKVIERCLAALKNQELPQGFKWEILLVDNNCTDDSVANAKACMEGSSVDFRIVTELEPGLANARKTGVSQAKYKYIIFCDHDNLLCPQYVSKVHEMFEADPKIGAIGGKGIPEFECEPDPRILPRIEGYAVGSQLHHVNWLFGAGMAVRTELVRDVYNNQNRYLVGRKGNDLLAGDDSELAYSIVLRGYRTCPTDEISYTHVLSANRLTWEYCQKMYAGFDRTEGPLMVMRMVLRGDGFGSLVTGYIKKYIKLVRYCIAFWRPKAAEVRANCRIYVGYINYWGMPKLYSIYREWTKIRKSASC